MALQSFCQIAGMRIRARINQTYPSDFHKQQLSIYSSCNIFIYEIFFLNFNNIRTIFNDSKQSWCSYCPICERMFDGFIGGDFSLFAICSLRFSKSFSRFWAHFMREEISPVVCITSESILEDLVTRFILKFKNSKITMVIMRFQVLFGKFE